MSKRRAAEMDLNPDEDTWSEADDDSTGSLRDFIADSDDASDDDEGYARLKASSPIGEGRTKGANTFLDTVRRLERRALEAHERKRR